MSSAAAPVSLRFGAEIIRHLTEGIIVYDPELRITLWSPFMERVTGRSADQVLGRRPAEVFPEALTEQQTLMVQRSLSGDTVSMDDARFTSEETGDFGWLSATVSPLRGEDGEVVGAVSIVRDVTDRHLMEVALQEAEARLRALVETIPAVTYTDLPNESMVTLYVSPQVEPILGLTQEEWLSDPSLWERHLHPDDRDAATASFLGQIETGTDEVSEYRMVRPDGRVVWIDDRARLVRDDSGQPVLLQGVMFDVTERREAEEAVRASEERYRMLFERNPQPMWVFDLETLAFLAVNDAAIDRYGYSRDEFLGMTILDIRPPEEAARVLEDVRRDRMGLDTTNSWVHKKKDGARLDVEITTHQIEFDGRPARLTLAIDVTDRNRATAELRESMEALQVALRQRQDLMIHLANVQEDERRRIASDIHDDSIQKMTAVGLRLQTLRRHLTDPEEIRAHDELAETVRLSIGRLRRLLFELRPPALDRDGLAAAVRLYVQETAREGGFEAGVENRLVDEPPLAIRTLVYRVAQEAITNARKHAPGSRVDVQLASQDGGILVRIRDDGTGFDPSIAMGTVAPGHLGINAMRERTEMAGGWWRIESAPETGTTVEFWVPVPAAGSGDDPAAT